MGKLENFLLWGTGTLLGSAGYIYIADNKLYIGSIGLLVGLFLILMGVVKYGNI